MAYPRQWIDSVQLPRKGWVLIERRKPEEKHHGIWIPLQALDGVKKAQATVIRSSSTWFEEGMLVLVDINVSMTVEFGLIDPRIFYYCREEQILGIFRENVDVEQVDHVGEPGYGRALDPSVFLIATGEREEGHVVAPRKVEIARATVGGD